VNIPAIDFAQVPKGLRLRLRPGEVVHHFTFINADGDKAGASRAGSQWFVVTSQRVLFGGNVTETVGGGTRQVHESCSLPLPSVSRVSIASGKPDRAGAGTATTHLTVNGRGAEIALAFPTREEALRVEGILKVLAAPASAE